MVRSLLPIALLSGCTPEEQASSPVPGWTSCADADCVQPGVHDFIRGDTARELHVWMPAEPAGAPVLFVWHHLGGSPEELLSWMPLEQAALDGFIVVAPASRGLFGSEWDVSSPPGSNADVALFDAMVESLVEDQGADPSRVYATGFSAGALFTTFLTLNRSAKLAATAPFSGGAPASSYRTPSHDIPVMLSWGGPSDAYAGFSFDAASRHAADALLADGHLVLTCPHGLGHWLPDDATERSLAFFIEHAHTGTVPDFVGCERHTP